MKAKLLIAQLHQSVHRIHRQYNKILPSYDQDALHDFRLEIKSLRAFLQLLASANREKYSRFNSRVKSVYDASGRIRNIQLHLVALDRFCKDSGYHPPAVYKSLIEASIENEKHHFRKLHHIDWEQFEKELEEKTPSGIDTLSIHRFLVREKMLLYGYLLASCTDENLHEIRKILKELLYNLDYLQTEMAFVFHGIFSEKESLDFLDRRLGRFHDTCIFLDFIHEHFNEVEDTDELAVLQSLKIELGRRRESMREELQALLMESRHQLEGQKVQALPEELNF